MLNNPKRIHLGRNVGIGANAFFLPVISDNGHTYNPSIIIGEGTWIGKGCSIAAINRVEIGKHVLFAGQPGGRRGREEEKRNFDPVLFTGTDQQS